MKFNIKKASPEDASTVLRLLTEFAEYENVHINEVKLTEEKFQAYGFGKLKCFDCDIGYVDESPVSYALYSIRFSGLRGSPVLYLEDLFVSRNFRNKGYGKKMLIHVLDYAKSINCDFMEWVVLNENTSAKTFYQNMGAILMLENIACRLSIKQGSQL